MGGLYTMKMEVKKTANRSAMLAERRKKDKQDLRKKIEKPI